MKWTAKFKVEKIFILAIVLLCGLFFTSAQAEIYKYVDEHGQVHYSNQKPDNTQYKNLQLQSEDTSKKKRKAKKIEIMPTKDLEKAVKEGKITQTVADRIQYYNSVAEEYSLAKEKKKAMKAAIAKAKSNRSSVSAEQLNQLEKEYDEFVKEEFFYIERNYTVTRQMLLNLLDKDSKKSARSSNKTKKEASINWN